MSENNNKRIGLIISSRYMVGKIPNKFVRTWPIIYAEYNWMSLVFNLMISYIVAILICNLMELSACSQLFWYAVATLFSLYRWFRDTKRDYVYAGYLGDNIDIYVYDAMLLYSDNIFEIVDWNMYDKILFIGIATSDCFELNSIVKPTRIKQTNLITPYQQENNNTYMVNISESECPITLITSHDFLDKNPFPNESNTVYDTEVFYIVQQLVTYVDINKIEVTVVVSDQFSEEIKGQNKRQWSKITATLVKEIIKND